MNAKLNSTAYLYQTSGCFFFLFTVEQDFLYHSFWFVEKKKLRKLEKGNDRRSKEKQKPFDICYQICIINKTPLGNQCKGMRNLRESICFVLFTKFFYFFQFVMATSF